MRAIPLTPETEAVARRVVWFEAPAEALEDPIRFMAYAMRYATYEDMRALRRYVSDDEFREALDMAPPGIIDPRSWHTGTTRWAATLPRHCRREALDNTPGSGRPRCRLWTFCAPCEIERIAVPGGRSP